MNSSLNRTLELEQAVLAPSGSSKTSMVLRAYQDYCNRRARGELVDPDAFCQQFPEKRSAIAKLIQGHLYLEENSFLLADASILEAVPFVPAGASPVCWPAIGSEFLGFHLLEVLGQGSFAKVYLAAEQKLGKRLVAVKVAVKGGAEANILGQIEHDNIVPIYSVQEDAETGLTAVCMPFAGRATLADLLDRVHLGGKVPTRANVILETVLLASEPGDAAGLGAERTLQRGTYADGLCLIGAQLADALACIHNLGICHRDLKPSNVLLSPAGVPMLLDFNLSADAADPRSRLGGTLPYMAPEQLQAVAHQSGGGPAALDARADIFSLGVILYELLTGQHPFGPVELKTLSRELCTQLLQRQQGGLRKSVSDLNPAVDRELSNLVQRCLAYDAAGRPQTAAELARLLRQRLSPLRRTRRWLAHHAVAVAGVAVLMLATATVGAYFIGQMPSPLERKIAAAESFYKEGKFADAVEQLTSALDINPDSAATYFARARAYQQMGNADRSFYKLALRDYEDAQRRAPDGQTLACLGYCCNLLRDIGDLPESYYKQAMKAGFRTAAVANNLGYMLLAQAGNKAKESDRALQYFDEAVSMDPTMQAAFHNRGRVRLNKILDKVPILDSLTSSKDRERAAKLQRKLSDEIDALRELCFCDLDMAARLGPASAWLDYDMACACGAAMRLDRKWGEPCLRHLDAAIKQGTKPSDVKKVEACLKYLKDDARFQKLLDGPEPQVSVAPVNLIVDPFKEHGR